MNCGKAPGKQPLLSAVQREALAGVVQAGPEPALHGVVRWRPDLAARSGGMAAHHMRGHGQPADIEPRTARARLPASCRRDRATMPQAEAAIAEFKKTFPPHWQRSGKASPPERR